MYIYVYILKYPRSLAEFLIHVIKWQLESSPIYNLKQKTAKKVKN